MRKLAALALLFVIAGGISEARAGSDTYHFGTTSQRTNITFESQTDFETVLGATNQLSGVLDGDFAKGTGSVSLEVPVASLKTGIDMRDDHLRSPMWLDAEKYPTISFVSKSARRLSGNTFLVRGVFTFHGISKEVTVKADVRPIPAASAQIAGLEPGEWIRVSVPFTIRLSDFGVMIPQMAAAKVNDTWNVKVLAYANTRG